MVAEWVFELEGQMPMPLRALQRDYLNSNRRGAVVPLTRLVSASFEQRWVKQNKQIGLWHLALCNMPISPGKQTDLLLPAPKGCSRRHVVCSDGSAATCGAHDNVIALHRTHS